jgi:hypothetical protein
MLRALSGFRLPTFAAPRPDASLGPGPGDRRTLRIYFIKPSTYDDDGYLLEFRWGVIPNNTLTVLAALNAQFASARPDVHVQTVLWDEMVDGGLSGTVISSICNQAAADGVELLIGLAGVQTNQYPRGRDIGLQFKRLGVPVMMGGFHVSSHAPTRDFLTSAGITVVVGEAETTWDTILDDYLCGDLQACYRVAAGVRAKTGMADVTVPLIRDAALPAIDSRYLTRFFNPSLTTIETSRGCPFACSYCAVKNVMGRTMRARDPQRVVDWIRNAHDRHGIRSLFLVDDDFFRSPQWEEVLTGMAALRRSGRDLWFMMQADVESAADADTPRGQRSRRFIDLAAEAGCYTVFMGFESFNPANLEHTLKFHNEAKQDRRRGLQGGHPRAGESSDSGGPHQRRGMNPPAEPPESPLNGTPSTSAFAVGFSRLRATEPGNSFPGHPSDTLAAQLSAASPAERRAEFHAAQARVKARYQHAVANWHRAGVGVHCGYIIGLPHDGKGCGARAARELVDIGVDLASFFVHTLLPGTEDYLAAVNADAITNHDFNDYDSMHYAGTHPLLTTEEIHREYREAWHTFYSWKRLGWSLATGHQVRGLTLPSRLGMLVQQLYFTYAARCGWHPMLGGIGRRYDRATRRRVVCDHEAVEHYLGTVPAERSELDLRAAATIG